MWRGSRWGAFVLVVLLAAGPMAWSTGPARAAAQTLRIGYSTWVGYGPLFLARDYHAGPDGHAVIAHAVAAWFRTTRACGSAPTIAAGR